MDSTHFLFRQGKLYPYWYNCMSYLYKCGVLGVICLLPGSTTTFYKPSEISSTLSFLLTTRVQELGWIALFTMRFHEIEGIIESNKFMIGKTFNGATIDDLIPIPVGYEEEYKKLYLETLDAEQALALLIKSIGVFLIDSEYQIYAILDKSRLLTEGIFSYANINEIKL